MSETGKLTMMTTDKAARIGLIGLLVLCSGCRQAPIQQVMFAAPPAYVIWDKDYCEHAASCDVAWGVIPIVVVPLTLEESKLVHYPRGWK